MNFLKTTARRPVSRVIAPAIGIGAGIKLIFTPLANGDSWLVRLKTGYANFNTSKNPMDLLDTDGQGNNAFTILAAQIEQNALPAAIAGVGAAVVYKVGRWFGL